ncbi:MAG: sugar phosphate isomerase/epimerase [Clostridia bacterium]|nr:sugar phosphate isomerase/epimerase [Clostridia bacterium]MBO4886032.1 sugar phosphate isomerase/epimerase [Clostridia bacterium]
MYSFSIGVMLESFRKPAAEAMAAAKALGAQGLQVYATPKMAERYGITTGAGRAEFLKMVKDNGLVISALCGDLGHGFGNAELNPDLVEKSKRIVDMALELGTNIVTTHIGVVPADPAHPRYKILQDACGELAGYADSVNAHFAVETGPETSLTLKNFLDSLHSTGVSVNLDPANLVMVTGDDPVQAVYNLKDYIVHTHAKDGRKLDDRDPEVIYGLRPGDPLVTSPAFIELALGDGDVPFPAYLKALDDIGYHGFLTIEREVGDNPAADIEKAVNFLRERI